ncbi:4816_t:CDS:2 [Diversispora eburnea]|uniref:4816_t:CDS:1 n=1 Tax=Diversispora eburnea TaxID=1213867 RepID=A0A9N9FKV6_9GLOM|nr:4816_t:CDS:2 [Diversispora eburnea]
MGNILFKDQDIIRNGTKASTNYHVIFPTNEEEIDRRHLAHNLMRELFRGNYSSPVHDVLLTKKARVLDVGDYSGNEFIGLDIVEITPKTVPFCVKFVCSDFLNGLPYENDTFDFIFMRFINADLTEEQWENFAIHELIMEGDLDLISPGPELSKLFTFFNNGLKLKKVNPSIARRLTDLLHSTQRIEDIQSVIKDLPFSRSWDTKLGKLGILGHEYARNTQFMLLSKFGKKLNVKTKNIENTVNIYSQEVERHHTIMRYYRVFGRKIIPKS